MDVPTANPFDRPAAAPHPLRRACPASVRCTTERFRQRFVMYAAGANLYDILDATKVADYVVLAMSSQVEVDDFGLLILGAIQAQGCPVIVPVVPDLEAAPAKQRGDIKKSLLSFIQHHFPNEPKVHALESPSDRLLFLRHLAEAPPRTVHWRESHPYLVRERCAGTAAGRCSVVVLIRPRRPRCGWYLLRQLVEEAEELADGHETGETVTVRVRPHARPGGAHARGAMRGADPARTVLSVHAWGRS